MEAKRNYLITVVIMDHLREINVVTQIIISNTLIKCIHKLINKLFSSILIGAGLEGQRLEQVFLKRAHKWLQVTQY